MSTTKNLVITFTCDKCNLQETLNYNIGPDANIPKGIIYPRGWVQISSEAYYDEHYCPRCSLALTGRRER